MARNKNRDEFTPATKRAIERQAYGHCSNPACRRLTSGATSDGVGVINIGEAAHICAAAPGGPRYDNRMTSEERRSKANGIWLCAIHARAVDSTDSKFTVEELQIWKRRTNEDSWRSVIDNVPYGPNVRDTTPDDARDRLSAAARADLSLLRSTLNWPASAVPLTLQIEGLDEPLSTRALADAVRSFDDLILVAAPGMGKTTTVFQIAEGVLESGKSTPLIVLLGDWATGSDGLLVSILRRSTFAGVSETEFRAVAAKPGVVLLLDGWNELDAVARERARVEISRLKAELPELGLVISTRRQSLNIPFGGTRVDLLPLGHEQQIAIARAMRGVVGERLVDQAWRTAGVRELMSIPLYLTTLLSLPEGSPFPTTKEEVLRRFVAAQEQEAGHAAALRAVAGSLHQHYLDGLAVFATTTANTAIGDDGARKNISDTTRLLIADGQLSFAPAQPDSLLDALVSNHVLMRSSDTPSYSFQHQQFQEWYASHEVERLMLEATADAEARDRLKSNVLNHRSWTEAILFATERAARGDGDSKLACRAAILAALEVDPMLAADMLFRATDDIWGSISSTIRTFVERWHTRGKLDRAVRFMITSGRQEFSDLLWPLLVHQDSQIRLGAFRAADRFQVSALGSDAAGRIRALPLELRKSVLHEIASNSGVDGLDLSTAIAKDDNDPEVKAFIADALAFRHADRHLAELLSGADDTVYDILAKNSHIDDLADEATQKHLDAARCRRVEASQGTRERLRVLLDAKDDLAEEVTDVVAEMDIERSSNDDLYLIAEVRQRYPKALADGVLRRVREGRRLFYGADEILADAALSLEDPALLDLALQISSRHDARAEAASAVLGPEAVGRMIDAYLAARLRLRDTDGRYDERAGDRYSALRDRLDHSPEASLIAAAAARVDSITDDDIAHLADLFSRDPYDSRGRALPFAKESASIGRLAERWTDRLIAGPRATRAQKASIATLISHTPCPSLLPFLKRLLDDNLLRYRDFRAAAIASGWRDPVAVGEAQNPHTFEYQSAFMAIRGPETDSLVSEYLTNPYFGESAARVLAAHWSYENEPDEDRKFYSSVDFSRVEARRAARAADPSGSSREADMIFSAVQSLLVEGATEEQRRLAVSLGIVGGRLPHGNRADTIDQLIMFASRRQRASLLLSLVLSGEEIGIGLVKEGIAATFRAAEKDRWILSESDAYQLRDWLRLLPFATPLSELPAIVGALPEAQRSPRMLEEILRGLGKVPSDDAEDVLFKLAEDDSRLYLDHEWRSTARSFGTVSAGHRFIDLIVSGKLTDRPLDGRQEVRALAALLSEQPEVRAYIHSLLNNGDTSEALSLLSRALAEKPKPEDLILLVEREIKTRRPILVPRSIEAAVTEQVPFKDQQNTYSIVPVAANDLRRRLLALTGSDGVSGFAARCLGQIDEIRDDYGAPETEPRHPDLASGRAWPVLPQHRSI